MRNIKQRTTVDDAFWEIKFWAFSAFCKRKGIKYISEITPELVEEHAQRKNTKANTIRLIQQRLNNLLNSMTEKMVILEEFDREQNIEPSTPQENPIEAIFADNFYRTFREFCMKKNIQTVHELTNKHFEDYSNVNGVGEKKVEAVKEQVRGYLKNNHNPQLEQVTGTQKYVTDHKGHSSDEINEVFSEQKFSRFRAFCSRRGITVLEKITDAHLEEFGNERQIGKTKVEEVRQMLRAYAESTTNFTSGNYYEFIKEQTVQNVLSYYGFDTDSESRLKIKDIEGKSMHELREEFTPALLMALSKKLEKQKHPDEMIKNLLAKFTDRELEVLQHRYGNNETLEQVGSHLGVTRERVRQIAKKFIKRISTYLKRERFAASVRIMAESKLYVTKKELINLAGLENESIINLLAYENLLFKYFKKMDLYFFDDGKKIDFSAVEEFIKELPSVFIFSDYEQSIKEALYSIGIKNPSLNLIQSLLEAEKFTKYGKVYSKHKLSVGEVLTYLFKHHIKEPFRIDDAGVGQLQVLADHHLDFELVSSVQSIENRLRDLESFLLVDNATFIYFDNDSFDTSVLMDIENYLNQEFRNREIINVEELFSKYKNQLQDAGVTNKIHLYSLLKYYLQDTFIIGQGNTLNIYKTKESIISVEEQLIRFMKQHGGQCSKKQLLEVIQPHYRLESAISASDKIIPWGSDYILFENLKFTAPDKNLFTRFVTTYFDKGYATASFILKEMMADQKLSSLLAKMKIDDYSKLTGVIKVLMPHIKGSANFLHVAGNTLDSFEKVICSKFTSKTSRKELKEFAYQHGYSERNAAEINKRLLERGIFIEIGLDELYPADRFKISQSELDEVCGIVELVMGRNEYLSLHKLDWYEDELPGLDFPWNAFLLKSVLEMCGYRQVKKIICDYRFDQIIVVRGSSPIQTFEDLVLHVIHNEYSGDTDEKDIYDFLAEKGILNEQEYMYQKVLPNEIKTSIRFIKALQTIDRK